MQDALGSNGNGIARTLYPVAYFSNQLIITHHALIGALVLLRRVAAIQQQQAAEHGHRCAE
jgi:hypothetical protein